MSGFWALLDSKTKWRLWNADHSQMKHTKRRIFVNFRFRLRQNRNKSLNRVCELWVIIRFMCAITQHKINGCVRYKLSKSIFKMIWFVQFRQTANVYRSWWTFSDIQKKNKSSDVEVRLPLSLAHKNLFPFCMANASVLQLIALF